MRLLKQSIKSNDKARSEQSHKEDVPRLVFLTADTANSQRPKFYIGDFARTVKNEEIFGKGYKQSSTDVVFEIASIPTLHPPTYSLIDADKEVIQGKFYQPEL